MAWARTVAAVVPSPATSEVLDATSRTICAPMFSSLSSSSISLATVTPSLVIVGEPNFFSMTTLRPLGPSVIFTASASWLTPRRINQLADAVKITLGPKGRNVVIEKKFGSPTITKDGVTVAKEIELEDKLENMGAQMVREVASKTSDTAGDGTTTATVLAQAIFREGVKTVAAGANPMQLKRGIERAVEAVVEEVKKYSIETKTNETIAQVGAISANGDATIGSTIAEAMKKVGKDGVITVEESKTMKTELNTVEGMQFDRGYLSPYFIS